jgi:preprotein translocase subunit YajC
MLISVSAFTVILLGVVFYCWFLRKQQRRLTGLVKMLEHFQKQTTSTNIPNKRAA